MKSRTRVLGAGFGVVVGALTFAAGAGAQAADPCDFVSSGASSFSYEQVKGCYESVPFEPADLINILDAVEQHRSFSDLAEVYDARLDWRGALLDLVRDYPGDAAMHDAIKREHHEFENVHVSYFPPQCYTNLIIGFTPFEFGSVVVAGASGPEQIIFVEGAPLAALYQEQTGIDAAPLVGQRVVSINGQPVLDYFRAYVEDLKIHTDAGGGLNGVLASDTYSIRLNGGGDYFPDRPADEYVLESIAGQRSSLSLPWLFVPRSLILPASALPLTASTEEFVRLCQLGPEAAPATGAASPGAVSPGALGGGSVAQPFGIEDERQELVQRLRALGTTSTRPASYFEIPPERVGQDIELITPLTNNASVLDYAGHVTALQLRDTVAWVDVAREGIEHACQNSDRLIVDLRGNSGGNDTVIRWLHHYLFPERGQLVPAGLLPFRLRNDNPTFNEMLFKSALFIAEYAPALEIEPCALNFTPGCLTDVETGEPLVAGPAWFESPTSVEERGGVPVSLARYTGIWNVGNPVFDSASCAGRFQGDALVFITDGRNASGGYFLPAAFEGEGIIVGTGGFLGEPMAMGRALSGGSIPGSTWAGYVEDIEAATQGEILFENEFASMTRPVNTRMEMLGIYRTDGRTLHIENPVREDLHADVWTDVAGSEGFVYERVLEVVDAARSGVAAPAARSRE